MHVSVLKMIDTRAHFIGEFSIVHVHIYVLYLSVVTLFGILQSMPGMLPHLHSSKGNSQTIKEKTRHLQMHLYAIDVHALESTAVHAQLC